MCYNNNIKISTVGREAKKMMEILDNWAIEIMEFTERFLPGIPNWFLFIFIAMFFFILPIIFGQVYYDKRTDNSKEENNNSVKGVINTSDEARHHSE